MSQRIFISRLGGGKKDFSTSISAWSHLRTQVLAVRQLRLLRFGFLEDAHVCVILRRGPILKHLGESLVPIRSGRSYLYAHGADEWDKTPPAP
jgi:hypothetical protein